MYYTSLCLEKKDLCSNFLFILYNIIAVPKKKYFKVIQLRDEGLELLKLLPTLILNKLYLFIVRDKL